MDGQYRSFREFYPAYLAEHENPTCRRLHFTGTSLVLLAITIAAITREWLWLLAAPVLGYGFAWIGHFVFERNRPATFRHPLYSLAGDFVLFRDMLTRKIPF